MSTDDEQMQARIRAAIGYSGKSQADIAAALGVSTQTVRRLNGADSKGRPARLEERQAIADACGVPPEFLEEGFARYQAEPSEDGQLHARVDQIGRDVADQAAELADLHKAIDELRSRLLTAPDAALVPPSSPDLVDRPIETAQSTSGSSRHGRSTRRAGGEPKSS